MLLEWAKATNMQNFNHKKSTQQYPSAGEFFAIASESEKIKLFEEAARGANKDQRKIVEEYNRKLSQKTA